MLNKNNLHDYQLKAIKHIKNVKKCALWLQMGMGKSVSTLTAIEELMYEDYEVNKVLIIAPLRVANTTWHNEAKRWEHLTNLTFSIVTGTLANRKAALQVTKDIYVINRENIPWLVEHYGKKFPFDMVVIDEASSFKSYSSKRFKALKKVLPLITRLVELTGTPASNGYMDLWSQIFLLDSGKSIGRTITNYRQRFFVSDYMGYSYSLIEGCDKEIQDRISHLVLSMSAEDYLELPKFLPTVLGNKLDGKLLATYKKFEKEMVLALKDDDKITAMSAATLSNKLLQFCSGNMYDEAQTVHHFHDLKLDTLQEIIDDSPDENILVAYNYKHELDALSKRFPKAVILDKQGKAVEQWNKGKIKILLAHPASAGHGLNLQKGGSTIVWYGFTWSLELYQQFNARLHRQGQEKPVRAFHIAVGEIEEKLMRALADKEVTQDKLLESLK